MTTGVMNILNYCNELWLVSYYNIWQATQ